MSDLPAKELLEVEMIRWADELGWLFDDDKFKPNSVAHMNPDVIRDGVTIVRALLKDRGALVRYVRAEELIKKTSGPSRIIELARQSYEAYEALSQEMKDAISEDI